MGDISFYIKSDHKDALEVLTRGLQANLDNGVFDVRNINLRRHLGETAYLEFKTKIHSGTIALADFPKPANPFEGVPVMHALSCSGGKDAYYAQFKNMGIQGFTPGQLSFYNNKRFHQIAIAARMER